VALLRSRQCLWLRPGGGKRLDADGEVADFDHVSGRDFAFASHRLAVDRGPVGALQVLDHELAVALNEAGVSPRHLGAGQHDVTLGVLAEHHSGLFELEPLRLRRSRIGYQEDYWYGHQRPRLSADADLPHFLRCP